MTGASFVFLFNLNSQEGSIYTIDYMSVELYRNFVNMFCSLIKAIKTITTAFSIEFSQRNNNGNFYLGFEYFKINDYQET